MVSLLRFGGGMTRKGGGLFQGDGRAAWCTPLCPAGHLTLLQKARSTVIFTIMCNRRLIMMSSAVKNTSPFGASFQKLRRARQHIEELTHKSKSLPEELYVIECVKERSLIVLRYEDVFDLKYEPKLAINEYFGSIIGDSVNNTREALDYSIGSILKMKGLSGKFHFPIGEDIQSIEDSKNYKLIHKKIPDVCEFIINEINPAKDGNFYIWSMNKLRNDNSHNDFIPIVNIANISGINAIMGSNRITNAGFGNNASNNFILIRSSTPIRYNKDYKVSTDLKFGSATALPEKEVISTLIRMVDEVESALIKLENLLQSK